MAKFKVVVTDYVFPNIEPEKQILGDIAEVVDGSKLSDEQLKAEVADADGVLNCYRKFPRPFIEATKKCKGIVRYGIGVDTIDLKAASEKKIIVCNVPDYCTDEVSDQAMALILACCRKLHISDSLVKSGTWSLAPLKPMYRLKGRTLGLFGFGKIPRLVAEKARAFGFKVITTDPYITDEFAERFGAKKVDFDTLLRESDVISVHAPLTEETRGVFNAAAFAKMKKGAVLVNTARGPLVNEADLAKALEEGKLSAAGLDVLSSEPPAPDNPILKAPNVILAPHAAWYSEESLVDLQRKAAEEMKRILTGQKPNSQVNKF
ncbi:MAG TPA: C-terminal binding protein [Firmicutes bacterium]|nr:C-terminal binding protein [Bacillota bacterium]